MPSIMNSICSCMEFGRNGECDKLGDLGEVRNCVCGLVGVFEEVGDPCIEEREFMGVLGIGGVFLVGTWQKVGKAIVAAAGAFGIIDGH